MSEEKLNEEYIRNKIQGICQDCIYLNKITPIIRKMMSENYIRGLEQGKFDNKMDLEQLQKENANLKSQLKGTTHCYDEEEHKKLKEKYNKALELLSEYNVPCELDNFMDKNTDYCSINCSVDDEIFKKCWDRYIMQEIKGSDKNEYIL